MAALPSVPGRAGVGDEIIAGEGVVSDQQDEEILRRRAREQAEIERQTDALVLRTLTTLVTASEELKSKLRRDTESLLEGYRRTKRQLENEISLTTAERLRSRREAEHERAEIIREARAQAREIVEAAKRERETMLAEVPAASALPLAPTTPEAEPPAAVPSPVASLTPSSPAPAPELPSRPVPFPAKAYTQQPAAARRRPVELVFDGVPGYQQASALERAVNDLLPNEEIDILQFDRGQLVLGLQAADLLRLADQLVAGSPASLELEAVAGDRAKFRCV